MVGRPRQNYSCSRQLRKRLVDVDYGLRPGCDTCELAEGIPNTLAGMTSSLQRIPPFRRWVDARAHEIGCIPFSFITGRKKKQKLEDSKNPRSTN